MTIAVDMGRKATKTKTNYFLAYYSLFIIKKGHYSLIIIPHPDPHSKAEPEIRPAASLDRYCEPIGVAVWFYSCKKLYMSFAKLRELLGCLQKISSGCI